MIDKCENTVALVEEINNDPCRWSPQKRLDALFRIEELGANDIPVPFDARLQSAWVCRVHCSIRPSCLTASSTQHCLCVFRSISWQTVVTLSPVADPNTTYRRPIQVVYTVLHGQGVLCGAHFADLQMDQTAVSWPRRLTHLNLDMHRRMTVRR